MNSENCSVLNQDDSRLSRCRFRDIVSASRRRAAWTSHLLFVSFMALLWAFAFSAERMNRSDVPLDSPWRWLLILSLFPLVFVGICALTWVSRHPLLKCPQCSHSLGWGMAPYQAIVTGRCPKCATTLFEDAFLNETESPDLPVLELVSRADLNAVESLARNSAVRPMLAWVFSGGLLLAIGSMASLWVRDLLAPWLGEIWTPFVAPVLLIPGISVGLWATVVWARHLHVSRLCPHCTAPISANGFASLTGNCSNCGQRAVSDPFPGLSPISHPLREPRWSIAEFHDLAKPRHDRLWIGCFIGAGLASAWIAPFLVALPSKGDSSSEGMTAYFICLGGILLFQCVGVYVWHRYSARGIHCSECDGELLQFYSFVISSRRCYHCGSTVLGRPDSEAGST